MIDDVFYKRANNFINLTMTIAFFISQTKKASSCQKLIISEARALWENQFTMKNPLLLSIPFFFFNNILRYLEKRHRHFLKASLSDFKKCHLQELFGSRKPQNKFISLNLYLPI